MKNSLISVGLATWFASSLGCAVGTAKNQLPKSIGLQFRGRPGESTDTRYYSNARILSYEDQQLVRDRTEIVDFNVRTHVTKYDKAADILAYSSRTTRKDGTVDLHDLSFPDLDEQIDYVTRGNGEVLSAGRFPPQSLFFVPSMPMPGGPVEVGDTWTLTHVWLSAMETIPLKLEVVGILKDIVTCEKDKVCADVEISGHVGLAVAPAAPGSHFASRIWGRLLFSLERGDVIWSEMLSREEMSSQSEKMNVSSCMVSMMQLATGQGQTLTCETGDRAVTKIPKL